MKLNKKIAAIVTTAAIALSATVGFTLAYFTDYTKTETNTITMGHVDIDLRETSVAGPGVKAGTATDDGYDYNDVMPGDVYSKQPVITVMAGSEDCYVRALVTLKTIDTGGDGVISEATLLSYLNIETTDWFIGSLTSNPDGSESAYVYYKNSLAAGANVTVFSTVSFPSSLTNSSTNDDYIITVKAEAIQAANVTPTTNPGGMITGWPAAAIEQYS